MGRAEELLSVLRNVIDIIAADESAIFGPYAISHGSALSPRGAECFRSSAVAAMEFGKARNSHIKAFRIPADLFSACEATT
jgi:hypothetical protein